MKPFQSGKFIASWLLRLLLAWFIYVQYFNSFVDFDFKSLHFYISAAFIIFGILLIIGGIIQKQSLTVISGLAVFILPVIQLIRSLPEDAGEVLLIYLIPISLGFYFFTTGNNN